MGFSSLGTVAQSPKNPLSRVINVSGTSQIAPSLSGDGKHMIFTTTANLKSELLIVYSYQQRPGKWTQPQPVTVINRSQKINHLGGYSLSYDGDYIFFTSRKTYGIGQYDIWYCKKTSKNGWSAPINLGKPVNSNQNDGCPSLSPDGKVLYFVRCESMDQKEGSGCRLMMAKRRNQDYWSEPEALPDHINDGNILSPKILVDNQTLLYAKGQGDAWDLYQTRLTAEGWSKPVALDFVNTVGNERFASVPAQGDVLYYSTKFKGTYDIIKARIPQEYQPRKVVYLKGEVVDQQGLPLEAFIQIYNVEDRSLAQYHRTKQNDSGFEFYIPAGSRYDFSVVPLAPKYTFYSEIFDLRELMVSSRKKMDIELKNLNSGISFPLHCLQFENDSTLSNVSRFEMSRLIKLMKNNPSTQVEIAVHRDSWEADSVLQADTTLLQVDTAMLHVDTGLLQQVDTGLLQQVDTALFQVDTTLLEKLLVTESGLQIVDSLQLPQEIVPEPVMDPTEIQAQAISRYLQERGVPEYLLAPKGYADSIPVAPNDTEEQRILNRRVEIKIL